MSTRRAIVVAAFLALTSTGIFAADVAASGTQLSEGGAEAMNRMGVLYATGTGVPKDYVAALAWYRRSAEGGSISAINNIATMYFHGLGVPQSYEETVKWLRQAVTEGDASEMPRCMSSARSRNDSMQSSSNAHRQTPAP